MCALVVVIGAYRFDLLFRKSGDAMFEYTVIIFSAFALLWGGWLVYLIWESSR